MRDVVRRLTDALERGREQIVCQVVETRGSTPQKAGALMVVDPGGGQAGTLGGGCVEAEVKRQALRALTDNEPGRTGRVVSPVGHLHGAPVETPVRGEALLDELGVVLGEHLGVTVGVREGNEEDGLAVPVGGDRG